MASSQGRLGLTMAWLIPRSNSKTIDHPGVGPITLDCGVLTVAGSDLRLVVYTAEPSSPDANRLRLVQVIGLQKLSARDRPT